MPTTGRHNHKAESIEFFKAFPDNHIDNDPYKILISQGDWTCSVARFTGTMKGPMKGPDGKMIPATNKKFEVEFCTVAHWEGWGDRRGEVILRPRGTSPADWGNDESKRRKGRLTHFFKTADLVNQNVACHIGRVPKPRKARKYFSKYGDSSAAAKNG